MNTIPSALNLREVRRRRVSRFFLIVVLFMTPISLALMLTGVIDKNDALLPAVTLALITSVLGIVWFGLYREPMWIVLQLGAVLSATAEAFKANDFAYISLHIIASVLTAAPFLTFLARASRVNHERAGGILPFVEWGILLTGATAWFVAIQPRPWVGISGPALDSFQYFWAPALHMMTVVPVVLLLARTRPSAGPTLLLWAYLLSLGTTVGTLSLGAGQSVPAEALPYFVPIQLGVALSTMALLQPSIVQLHQGTVPWRPPRAWQRTAYVLLIPTFVVAGLAVRSGSWASGVWPLLMVISIGSVAVTIMLSAKHVVGKANLPASLALPAAVLSVDNLVRTVAKVRHPRSEVGVIVVMPIPDSFGHLGYAEEEGDFDGTSLLFREATSRMLDVIDGAAAAGGQLFHWRLGVDQQRIVVVGLTPSVPPPGQVLVETSTDLPAEVTAPRETSPGLREVTDRLAATIVSLLAVPFRLDGVLARVEFAVGYATDVGPELISTIQDASWAAKTGGPGEPRAFDPAQRLQARRRAQLAAILGDALSSSSIVAPVRLRDAGLAVGYVPVLDLVENRSVAAVIEVDWRPPGWSAVEPAELHELAEQTRSEVGLSDWALALACTELEGDGGLVHRLSVVELRRADLVSRIDSILDRTDAAPASLTVQVSDAMMRHLSDLSSTSLRSLARMGVHLSLGGFGQETTGLSRLISLPWHSLSLAPTLTAGIKSERPQQMALVRTVVEMAQEMGVKVAAGQVQDEEEVAVLASLGCNYASGPVVGMPKARLTDALAFALPTAKVV